MNLSTAAAWPKGEQTFGVSPTGISAIPWPVLILMGLVLIVMLVVWWRSKRNKQ